MSTIERLRAAIDPILSTANELRGQENEDMRVRQEQEAAELTARHAQEAMDLASERARDDRVIGAVMDALAAVPD